jgi:hypothetical protein
MPDPINSATTSEAPALLELVAMPDEQLRRVDPLVMNLVVAKGIPNLADLDIGRYQQLRDQWANDAKRALRAGESQFHAAPHRWKNDLHFFRLTGLAWFMGTQLGIGYREGQRERQAVFYTDPTDLFLNGVMDSRRGTCGNMAALYVALA